MRPIYLFRFKANWNTLRKSYLVGLFEVGLPQSINNRKFHLFNSYSYAWFWCSFSFILIRQCPIIITRPKPAYGRQGLAGSWGQDTDEVSTFLVFLTSHFAPAALSSDLTNLGPLMTMKIHLETFKNHGNQPKTMKNHETTLKIMETKQKP